MRGHLPRLVRGVAAASARSRLEVAPSRTHVCLVSYTALSTAQRTACIMPINKSRHLVTVGDVLAPPSRTSPGPPPDHPGHAAGPRRIPEPLPGIPLHTISETQANRNRPHDPPEHPLDRCGPIPKYVLDFPYHTNDSKHTALQQQVNDRPLRCGLR